MLVLPLAQARAGMKVARDIYSAAGIKLMSGGMALTDNHIARLRLYQIREVEIGGDEIPGEKPAEVAVFDREQLEERRRGRERARLADALKSIPQFSQFDEAQLARLTEGAKEERYDARTPLFTDREPGSDFHVILQGAVKIFTRDALGRETILSVLREGGGLGELSPGVSKLRQESAATLETTSLLAVPRERFMELLADDSDIAKAILAGLKGRLADTRAHQRDLQAESVHTRVTKSLIRLARDFGVRSGSRVQVRHPLDFRDLARLADVEEWQLQEVIRDLQGRRLLKMEEFEFELELGGFAPAANQRF